MNRTRLFKTLSIVALLMSGALCIAQEPQATEDPESELTLDEQEQQAEQKKQLFRIGYEFFNDRKYQRAATGFYDYMAIAEPGDENYEWAQFFYAISLEKLGYSHAAVDTFARLATRKPNTKIVVYILSYFDTISRSQPFDQELVIANALNGANYDFIDDDLAAMVHYHQGVYDAQFGLEAWAKGHFEKIPETSNYFAYYQYHLAIAAIEAGEISAALAPLDRILQLPQTDAKLQDLTLWTSARLLFELGEHAKAIARYKAIKTPVTEQASFLLERAWNQYKLQNYRRAMGLLYAYQAPDFSRFFTPEMFILKALIYKSLCHYESTLATVDAFYQRYQQALDAVYDRKRAADPESQQLLLLVLNNEAINRQWQFIRLLETEKSELSRFEHPAIQTHLTSIYDLKISQAARHLRTQVDKEYERLANLLLEYEENINLVRYEAGVDRYQTTGDFRYQKSDHTEADASADPSKVIYPFQGEFWNDEFDDYKVHLADECAQEDNWEVFFE